MCIENHHKRDEPANCQLLLSYSFHSQVFLAHFPLNDDEECTMYVYIISFLVTLEKLVCEVMFL